jgi:MYXO-CTERM domain-containing protein
VNDHCAAGACVAGMLRSCGSYACDKGTGECLSRCASVRDCVDGKVCSPEHECVDPPPGSNNLDNSGCALAPVGAPEGSPWPPAALSLLALGALGARRRKLKRPGLRKPSPAGNAAPVC